MSSDLAENRGTLKNSFMRGVIAIAFVAMASMVYQQFRSYARTEQDGPTSVIFGNTYQKGELQINSYDLTAMPPLPAGYEALNNRGYLITTTAVVSGPHVVRFVTPSVKEEETFKRLRIFHAEPDPFDPESPVWIDRTIVASDEHGPNFRTKSLNAASDELGVFVIAKLVREVAPITATTDLSVSCEAVVGRVRAPETITYIVKVLNHGPNTANDIGLINSLTGPVTFISVEPSQGRCKKGIGHFYCKLGSLKPGEVATITVKHNPDEGIGSFPSEGATAANASYVEAQEKDPNIENNRATDTVLILPDLNLPPSVTLVSPKDGERVVGPVDITLEANASDDRGIEKVEFYGNGHLIGKGTSVDGKKFVLVIRRVSFGKHRFWAIATDTGGRNIDSESALVLVNGAANIQLGPITDGNLVEPEMDLTLTATVTHPSGMIAKVEVFGNEEKLGDAGSVGESNYRFVWKSVPRNVYSIVLAATDASGIITTSIPLKITVSKPPTVKIVKPTSKSSFDTLTDLSILVIASQQRGVITKVDLYANDRLLGSASDVGTDRFTFIWENVPAGEHSLKAVAINELGVTGKSETVVISAITRNRRR